MNPHEAAILAASAIGAAARVPLSEDAAERLSAFWLQLHAELSESPEEFFLLLRRIKASGRALREKIGDAAVVTCGHMKFLHDHLEAMSRRSDFGPTRFCIPAFEWVR